MPSISSRDTSPLIECLRRLRGENWSGAVRVQGAKDRGAVYLIDGRIVHAECGRINGEFAYWQLMGVPDVRIDLDEHGRPDRHSILRPMPMVPPRPLEEPVRRNPGVPAAPPPRAARPPEPPPAEAPRREAPAEKSAGRTQGRGARGRSGDSQKAVPGRSGATPRGGQELVEGPARIDQWMRQFRETLESSTATLSKSRLRRPERHGRGIPVAIGLLAGMGIGAYMLGGLPRATDMLGRTREPLVRTGGSRAERAAAPGADSQRIANANPSGSSAEPAAGSGPPVDLRELADGDELPALLDAPAVQSPDPRLGLAPDIVVRVLVDAEGRVSRSAIYRPRADLAAFEQAAQRAVEKYRFKPARRQGRAVAVWINVPVHVR